jgi:invasion protein IalB
MRIISRLFLLATFSGFALQAFAQTQVQTQAQPNAITQFGDWAVFITTTPKGKNCYTASQPKERLPKNVKVSAGYIYVSTRPGEKVTNEISFALGYPHKEKTDATATMGLLNVPLYTQKESAFVKVASDDARLLTQMKASPALVVKGTSARGTSMSDSYSLNGLSSALERIKEECSK